MHANWDIYRNPETKSVYKLGYGGYFDGSIPPPSPCSDDSSSGSSLEIELLTDDYGIETKILIINSDTGNELFSVGPFSSNLPYNLGFCIGEPGNYDFVIQDAASDGGPVYDVLVDGVSITPNGKTTLGGCEDKIPFTV